MAEMMICDVLLRFGCKRLASFSLSLNLSPSLALGAASCHVVSGSVEGSMWDPQQLRERAWKHLLQPSKDLGVCRLADALPAIL